MYDITVVGTGYVGLVTGACLADFGNNVTCVDNDAAKVERMKALELPFFEPGLPEIVARNFNEGRLHFSSDLAGCVRDSQVVFITVGTPPRADGSADTSQIYAVAKTVAPRLSAPRATSSAGSASGPRRARSSTSRRTPSSCAKVPRSRPRCVRTAR